MEINWSKTKLQVFDDNTSPPSKVSVLGHDVEVVDSYTCIYITMHLFIVLNINLEYLSELCTVSSCHN